MIWPSKAPGQSRIRQLYGPPTVPVITFRSPFTGGRIVQMRTTRPDSNMTNISLRITSHLARPALAYIISAANRDGQFVYDQHIVNNTGDFSALGDAVMYASWSTITGNDTHATNVAKWIDQRWHCPNTKSYVFLTSCTFFLCLTQLLSC